jgi:hypothetical protein
MVMSIKAHSRMGSAMGLACASLDLLGLFTEESGGMASLKATAPCLHSLTRSLRQDLTATVLLTVSSRFYLATESSTRATAKIVCVTRLGYITMLMATTTTENG